MKTPRHFSAGLVLLLVITFAVFSFDHYSRANAASGNVTIIATVSPQRIIIVDKNMIIQQIISNTALAVRPVVFLEKAGGEQLSYVESIRKQYQYLQSFVDFSRPGVVYEKKPDFLSRLWAIFFKEKAKTGI